MRTIIKRTVRGHVVEEDPQLVLRARMAIRQRRDAEALVWRAAA